MAPPAKTAFSLTVVMQEAVRVTATGSQQSHGTSTTAGLMAALEELSSRPERRADILQNHARVSDERGATMLHLAAAKGDLSAVKLLLSHSPPVLIDSFASGGLTPLHLASQQGHAAVVAALRSAGQVDGEGLAEVQARKHDAFYLHLSFFPPKALAERVLLLAPPPHLIGRIEHRVRI